MKSEPLWKGSLRSEMGRGKTGIPLKTTYSNASLSILYVPGTAHCANMYPESPDDPPQLKQARQKIEDLVGQWLASA